MAVLGAGCGKSPETPSSGSPASPSAAGRKVTVGLMPKSKGNAFFVSVKKGADAAARERDVELIYDGPTDPDPARQNEIVENWITLGVDVIAIACENKEGISTALRKARQKGIKVLTYDSDSATDARSFFVNQATPEGIGGTLVDEAARLLHGEGDFAIITASLTAQNMNEWQKHIEARRASAHPGLKMVALRPCDDMKDKAQAEATAMRRSGADAVNAATMAESAQPVPVTRCSRGCASSRRRWRGSPRASRPWTAARCATRPGRRSRAACTRS